MGTNKMSNINESMQSEAKGLSKQRPRLHVLIERLHEVRASLSSEADQVLSSAIRLNYEANPNISPIPVKDSACFVSALEQEIDLLVHALEKLRAANNELNSLV